jgi:hypothetical protein
LAATVFLEGATYSQVQHLYHTTAQNVLHGGYIYMVVCCCCCALRRCLYSWNVPLQGATVPFSQSHSSSTVASIKYWSCDTWKVQASLLADRGNNKGRAKRAKCAVSGGRK